MSAPPAATDSKTSGTVAHQRAILAIICISYFMVILDNSIIFTGLPPQPPDAPVTVIVANCASEPVQAALSSIVDVT